VDAGSGGGLPSVSPPSSAPPSNEPPSNEPPSDAPTSTPAVTERVDPVPDTSRDILDTTLAIDVSAHTATASVTLAASPSTGASFEIGDLDIRSVRHGEADLTWVDRGTTLDVMVPSSTEPLVLTIEYAWHWHASSDGVSAAGYTVTWPYWCGNVFPCRSEPSDGTTFHLNVTGVEAGRAIYPSEILAPAPPYMAAWIVGDYVDLELGRTTAGTRVVMRALRNDTSAATAGGAHVRAAFDWMEKNLGAYRFGSVVGPVEAAWVDGGYGGLEHHPFWHIAVAAMGDESVHVHEAAHGWFGNGVRLRCWEDFVLSEGTVSYLAPRILEEVAGPVVSAPVWTGYLRELDGMRADPRPHLAWPRSCGQVDILKDGLYTRAPYVKGALFYRAIERKVGRPALDSALRTFYGRWAGRAAGMQDMLDVIGEATGYNPQACATAWLIDAQPPTDGACPP
jgi:aminopeptidase N